MHGSIVCERHGCSKCMQKQLAWSAVGSEEAVGEGLHTALPCIATHAAQVSARALETFQ